MPLLKPKNDATTKVLGVRIPGELFAQLQQVRTDADAAGLALPVNEVLTDAVARLVRQAQAELRTAKAVPAPGGEA